MKRFLTLLAALLVAGLSFNSCSDEYYEPVFGPDNLPAVIPAEGGNYAIAFEYIKYETKADITFEWEYRLVVGRDVLYSRTVERGDWGDGFFRFSIPANGSGNPRPIIVEASTHILDDYQDYWGDWTPVCSSVQLAR